MIYFRFTILFVLICFLGSTLKAQKTFQNSQELSVSIGAFPFLYHTFYFDEDELYFPDSNRDYYYGPRYFTGSITAGYNYRVTKWYDIGARFSYAGQYRSYYDLITDAKVHTDNINNFFFVVDNRIPWLNKPIVRCYSAIDLGVGVAFRSDRVTKATTSTWGLGLQFTFIGVSVGKKLFGFSEFGIGNQGIFKAGVGYRFNSNQ